MQNVLFVCSRNQWRSPTAEHVFRKHAGLQVRSRGTSRNARRPITKHDIQWADVILVMEQKHKQRLLAEHPGEMRFQSVHVLDIPDEYAFMDPTLIELLLVSVPACLRPFGAD
jgi:predicted protein tyrosine phosphatase